MVLVLALGDLHVPHKALDLPAKFKSMLVPGKIQHIICTGNLCIKEVHDDLKTVCPDLHITRGEHGEDPRYPETKTLKMGQLRLGICHGHQVGGLSSLRFIQPHGIEVKPGESLKVQPEFGKLIHISQAALGEVKEAKAAKNVPLRLKVDAKNFIIGTLSAEDRTQLMFDLVLEKDFELSHDWKNGSVYFIGYTADDQVSDGEDFSDEFEVKRLDTQENGDIKPHFGNVKAAKSAAAAKVKSKKEVHPGFDEDEDDTESDSDDEMAFGGQEESSDVSGEDSEEDADGRSTEEELPKVQQSKKRPTEAAQEAPVPAKKAKVKSATPDKTASAKTPAGNKAKEQTPKSGGQHSCKSCNKSFNSEKSLQSHTKAKHESK